MIQGVAREQNNFLNIKPEEDRKGIGQFFTGPLISDYMASMIDFVGQVETVRIVDAGAGVGILTCSAALRCLELGYTRVHAVLYETDKDVVSYLRRSMDQVSEAFNCKDAHFSFDIRQEDFVLSRPDRGEEPFHISSINPPYFKYNSESPYSGATADLFKGNPNIYASFMAVVLACLAPNGQMVAIVPRSFANGLYFKGFRHYLSQGISLESIHTFKSRSKVFKNLEVLQENIICKFVKHDQVGEVEIRSSTCSDDLHQSEVNVYPTQLIIDSTNSYNIIRIPETEEDARTLSIVENWPNSFEGLGYFISTGPVVEHRTFEYITSAESLTNSVPLLRMHNVKAFRTEWSGTHRKDAKFSLLDGYEKHISSNEVYVLLKRFSSKEEKRRLVAGVYDPNVLGGDFIGLENHLNYIGLSGEHLDLTEAFGIAALFNSTFMDRYFRSISGNTQVNATEIRLLKLPDREAIQALGHSLLRARDQKQETVDAVVNRHIDL